MILFDGRYLFVAAYGGSVVFTYHRGPTIHCIGIGALEITIPRWGHKLTRWRDVPDTPRGKPEPLTWEPRR